VVLFDAPFTNVGKKLYVKMVGVCMLIGAEVVPLVCAIVVFVQRGMYLLVKEHE
jgi:hypothetical protein